MFYQCSICSTVFTKKGIPERNFSSNDRIIYGCTVCSKGNWKKNVKILENVKINENDLGYLDVKSDSLINPSWEEWKKEQEEEKKVKKKKK